ncbi:MAG: non-heme iron oxygenase ferredoxin subunit [Betaproteobacteria bacterium]|nr:non-heme iron oxygenase ferredoxin subunit [Betaproteobacteria bacterium]
MRIRVCGVADLEPGRAKRVLVDHRAPIAVFNIAGKFYVTDDDCTHGLSSLAKDGQIEGDEVECGWHGGRFNIITGEPTFSPCVVRLNTYAVAVVAGDVFADVG